MIKFFCGWLLDFHAYAWLFTNTKSNEVIEHLNHFRYVYYFSSRLALAFFFQLILFGVCVFLCLPLPFVSKFNLPQHCIHFSSRLCIEQFVFYHRATEHDIHRAWHHHHWPLDVIVDWPSDNRLPPKYEKKSLNNIPLERAA